MSSDGHDIIVDDENTAFVSYSSASDWADSHDAGLYGSFQDQSYHYTYTPGASVTFAFTGSYVAYYADLNSDHGAFLASIDGGPSLEGTSYAANWSGSPRLLFDSQLVPGSHALTITNGGNSSTHLAAGIDFFVYRAAQSSGDVSSTTPTIYDGQGPEPPLYTPFTPPPPPPSSSTDPASAIPAPRSTDLAPTSPAPDNTALPAHTADGSAGTPQLAAPALIGLAFVLFAFRMHW